MGEPEAQEIVESLEGVVTVTFMSPEGEVLEHIEQMKLVSPLEGICIIPGFTKDEVLGYIHHFIKTLAAEIIREDTPPTLIFPLDGAVFAYDLLITYLLESGYSHFNKLEVLFAAKDRENVYIIPNYKFREGARVIVVDDIADRLDAFNAISEAIGLTPELYAMSRKATTDIGKFKGYCIQAVFPLFNGNDLWCNCGLGMNRGDESSTRVRALERCAVVCVRGKAANEAEYIQFLIDNSYYYEVLDDPIFLLLEEIDQMNPVEKLVRLEMYHEEFLERISDTEP